MRYLGAALCVYGTFNLGLVLLKRVRGLAGGGDLVCREDDVACKVASKLGLDKYATRGVLAVLFIGLMSSFTILPCSAQLLFSYILITLNMHIVTWTMLTLYYVLVFILPVIALYLAMIGISKLKSYQQLIARNEWLVKLIGSSLMIGVAIYILVRGEGLYAW
jgi:cytochrome c biogenesis protein CcdA